MKQFAKRFNKVFLDELALEKKQNKLLEENSKLKSVLKQYLDGISLSESVLAQSNPLIIVNGKTNVSFPLKQQTHITCVEAQHCFPVMD
jgi:dynein regulatory complex subunit 2